MFRTPQQIGRLWANSLPEYTNKQTLRVYGSNLLGVISFYNTHIEFFCDNMTGFLDPQSTPQEYILPQSSSYYKNT